MARSLWKGAISFGLVNVPVELHSAKKRAAELDMTMLDKRDLAPVGYKRVNKSTGKEVAWGDVVKGYEYKDDQYVVLSDEDFRRANPEASRTVDILAFVDLADIQPQYFETPYYLKPEKRGEKAYALLRETLHKAGKAGVASVVIRTKQYLAALVAQDDLLVLNTLRYAEELKPPAELEIPRAKVTPKELDMALRLVEDMADEWHPEKYKDSYRDDLLKRIKEKVKAGETEELTAPEKEEKPAKGADVIDLMSLLKKSVEHKSRPAKRAKRASTRRRAA
jgi:DNA end-binding protein Ku